MKTYDISAVSIIVNKFVTEIEKELNAVSLLEHMASCK